MSTLHIGTKDADAVLALLPNDVKTFVEYDCWEEWGEHKPEDRAYSGVHHIIVMGQGMDRYLADLGYLLEQSAPLEPMRGPAYQRGTMACITQDQDWSEEIIRLQLGWYGVANHASLVNEAPQVGAEG